VVPQITDNNNFIAVPNEYLDAAPFACAQSGGPINWHRLCSQFYAIGLSMKNIYQYLAFLGTLPFIICAASFVSDVQAIPVLGDTRNVLGAYALVITAFMAGSHWGQHLDLDNKWGDYLPIISNVIAVLVWIGFLVLPFKIVLFVFTISFLVLLWIDQKLCQNDLISYEYLRTRYLITIIVVFSLFISGIYA